MAKEVTERSNGELAMEFHGGTLLTKELEIINAVKAGNIAMGDPGGAAATVFPEMGVFLVPYLIASYDQAYKMFNGAVGDRFDKQFQDKYKLKVLFFYDYGFRHFWNSKRPIAEPKDLRGLKMRVQQAKVFADTINGLGGVAVPMAWGEVIPAAQQGVIDGADLPIVNILALKAYEVSKYCSMTYHNYGPTALVMNLGIWNGLAPAQQKLLLDASRTAQERIRGLTESVDTVEKAREHTPRPARAGRGRGPRQREGEGHGAATVGSILLFLPKIVVTALLVLAIADMLAGVFLRYVMVEVTDFLDFDPVNFFWVEEVGEFSLTWLTMIGAAIGIADRIHFTLHVLTHHLPLPVRRVIYVINNLLIAGFGGLAAWFGTRLAISNSVLTSPALQINLGWVYAAVSVGGALIAIYGLGLALAGPNTTDAQEDAVVIAAGD